MSKTSLTIRDVALAAGVSKSAVSAAFTGNGRLSPETRTAILQTATQLGFEPNPHARRLQNNGLSDLIGLFTLDFDLSVGTRKLKVIRHLLGRAGFNVQIHSCGYGPQASLRELRLLRQQRPRAIICNTTDLPFEALELLRAFGESGGIVVCYDHPVALDCDSVVFDRADNTNQAAKHLLELGHRKIGFFQVGNSQKRGERFKGFRAALVEFNLVPHRDWLFESAGVDEFESDGAKMAAHFLSLADRPTGVCIVNDFAALSFIAEVERAGVRVPRDVAVVGHDDRPVARYCSVPISSVSQPVELIAQKVVELLTFRLQSEAAAPFHRETVRGELVVRASSGAHISS